MKYYILNSDDTNMDKYIMCDSAAIGDTNQYDVMSGRRIGLWEEKVLLYSSSNKETVPDYIDNSLGWFVVKLECKDMIVKYFGDFVEVLPVTVRDRNNIEPDFTAYVINVVDVVENAIDMQLSKYRIRKFMDKELISFQSHVLSEAKLNGHHIFKASEHLLITFIDETFKNIIEENKFTGFRFDDVESV